MGLLLVDCPGGEITRAALLLALASTGHDVRPGPEVVVVRVRADDFPEPCALNGIERKSKGEKRRDRAERRAKGWR